ncbi:MAG: hypothetical protein K9J77_11755 [Rhodoferax sp.]|nr:hypothetical protein [Rhodoferax sp.]
MAALKINAMHPAVAKSDVLSYWRDSAATWTYRSASRYLRRHVIRDANRLGNQVKALASSTQLADLLSMNHHAKLAYTEVLWACHMEAQVERRRWPYRNVWGYTKMMFTSNIASQADLKSWRMTPRNGRLPNTPFPLDRSVTQWLEYHACAATIMATWHFALIQAESVAQTGKLETAKGEIDVFDLLDCSAVLQQDGSVHFLGLANKGAGFGRLALPDKQGRKEKYRRARTEADRQLLESCSGLCLTWTEFENWHVADALKPDTGVWQRHNLLGLSGPKLRFWIFQNSGRFVARLCSERLQTVNSSASGVIKSLRFCTKQYVRAYGLSSVVEETSPAGKSPRKR